MGKQGIGKHNDDKDINLSSRGLINALSVEIVDPSGNQVTSFVSTPTGLVIPRYDSFTVTYPSTVSEVYAFSYLGSSVATLTITYTDSTKSSLLSAVLS